MRPTRKFTEAARNPGSSDLLRRLARVPKREIDEQEAKYQQERKTARAALKRKRA